MKMHLTVGASFTFCTWNNTPVCVSLHLRCIWCMVFTLRHNNFVIISFELFCSQHNRTVDFFPMHCRAVHGYCVTFI